MTLITQPNDGYYMASPHSVTKFAGESSLAKPPSAVLVCGGRDYDNKQKVFDTLDTVCRKYPIREIITGDAKGADTLARKWVDHTNFNWGFTHTALRVYFADWTSYGRSAGPKRNKKMLEYLVNLPWDINYISALIAFPGGRGTANMISQVEKWNKRTSQIINIWRL